MSARNTIESLLAKTERTDGGCWIWLGRPDDKGYGTVSFEGRSRKAHRAIYEALIWPVGVGLELDHTCRNRSCCNPMHLEEVTHLENMRRGVGNGNSQKTHCKNGHEFSKENTAIRKHGWRTCRRCNRERAKLNYWKNPEKR